MSEAGKEGGTSRNMEPSPVDGEARPHPRGRDSDCHRGAEALPRARRMDSSSVRLHDVPRNGQAHTERPTIAEPNERLEHPFNVGGTDPAPRIGHGEHHLHSGLPEGHSHMPPRGCVLDGVPKEVPNHMRDFLAAIQSRGKPVADIEQGHISTASCILANLALQVGRPLTWDLAKGQVVGDAEANRLLKRQYRGPWIHPAGKA